MKKRKVRNTHKYLTLAIIFLIVTGMITTGILAFSVGNLFGSAGEQVVYTNDLYQLRGNPTTYQKDLFKKLTNELGKSEKDEFAIVSLVAQNFIADYYTWSNKLGTYDVGGKTFIFADEFTNFNSTSRRYIYDAMSVYLANGIQQNELNEVESVTINSVNYAYDYSYYGKPFVSFYLEASWTYKANDKIDTSVFPNWGAFTVIKTEEGRYEIARFY